MDRSGCHRLRRTLQFVAVLTQLVQGLVHQQVHVLLHQTRCSLRVTESVDGRVDFAVSRQRNAVLLHVAKLVDHLSQLIVVVGARLGYKSSNNVSDVLSDTIAGPPLGAVSNVLVDAVISVELSERIDEAFPVREVDTHSMANGFPRQVFDIFDRCVAPVGNSPRLVLNAHESREATEVGRRHVEQSGTSAVVIVYAQDE